MANFVKRLRRGGKTSAWMRWLGGLHGNSDTFFANAVAAVEDDRALCVVTNGGQFHASWTVDAKVDACGFSSSHNLALSHGELVGDQMAQFAQTFFNGCTKCLKINFLRSQTDHAWRLQRAIEVGHLVV